MNNLVPYNGELYLIREFYKSDQAEPLFQQLLDRLHWQQEQLYLYGKWFNVPRLMCWYGDVDAYYRYSGVNHTPHPWIEILSEIKLDIEDYCACYFNSVMANLYRDGQDSMGCHADDERELGENPRIASLSFGEKRVLRFRHQKHKTKLDIELGAGDLLIMAGELQHFWHHELPKTRKPKQPRINLTFRRIL